MAQAEGLYLRIVMDSTTSNIQAKTLLKLANKSQALAISEVIKNVLGSVLTLTEEQRKHFWRKRKLLRLLATKRLPVEKRRKLIVQHRRIILDLLRAVSKQLATLL